MNNTFGETSHDRQYHEVIQELEARGTYPDRPPGIETTQKALEKLGHTPDSVRKRFGSLNNIIVVAGTNGKGSVCAVLSALLQEAGESVGLFTSPHLVSHVERIQLNRKPISREQFVELYRQIDRATDGLRLTHFEMLTVMAYEYFHRSNATYAIFEVGLGGKWDSTNAIPHKTCIISRIGLDHQHLLGHKVSLIAENKFGIITHGAQVISQPIDTSIDEANRIKDLKETIKRNTSCDWSEAFACDYARTDNSDWIIESKWGRFPISLKGKRGVENVNLALSAFEKLGFDPSQHAGCLNEVRWAGRFDEINIPNQKNIRFIFSADHNVQGFESLFEILTPAWPKRVHFLLGFGCEKNWRDILSMVEDYAKQDGRDDYYYLTETPFRGARLLDYGPSLKRAKVAHRDPLFVLRMAYEFAEPGDTLLISGSVYLVGKLYTQFAELKVQIDSVDKVLTH